MLAAIVEKKPLRFYLPASQTSSQSPQGHQDLGRIVLNLLPCLQTLPGAHQASDAMLGENHRLTSQHCLTACQRPVNSSLRLQADSRCLGLLHPL